MFKNRSVQVKIVKDAAMPTATEIPLLHVQTEKLIEKINKIDVKRAAVGLVAVYAAVVGINTLSEVVINIVPKN